MTKIEIKHSEDASIWQIVATNESGFQHCLDMHIRTERGAKSRLTYWRNWYIKRGHQVA